MPHGLRLQAPPVVHHLHYLKNASSIKTISIQLRSITIRHIPNTTQIIRHTRHFSFIGSKKDQFSVPIPSKFVQTSSSSSSSEAKASTTHVSSSTTTATSSSSPAAKTSITHASENKGEFSSRKCIHLIKKGEYYDLLPFLLQHKSEITSERLYSIFKQLEHSKQSQTIINIHKNFPVECFKSQDIIELLLRTTSKAADFELFEIIFSKYLEIGNHSIRYCNMALSAFLKNRNIEFAKQMLYQMVNSHLPMNSESFLIFLRSVNNYGTFQSVKFAIDVLKQNPNIDVSGEVYSEIIEYYVRYATSQEVEKLSIFLAERNHDLYEIEVYQFLRQLRSERGIDYKLAWEKIEDIREQLKGNTRFQLIFYKKLADIFASRNRLDYISRTIEYMVQDGLGIPGYMESTIHVFFRETGDVEGLMKYLNLVKSKKGNIESIHVYTLWKTLLKSEPDLIEWISKRFEAYIPTAFTKKRLNERYLKDIKITHKTPSASSKVYQENPDEYLSKTLKQVKSYISNERYEKIIPMVNDQLRSGLKPQFLFLRDALAELIKVGSQESDLMYRLCRKIDQDHMIDYDLLWLRKVTDELKTTYEYGHQVQEKGSALVKDFRSTYQRRMSPEHYCRLAHISTNVHDTKLAIDLLLECKNTYTNIDYKAESILFYELLKACARSKDVGFYFKVLDAMLEDPNLRISKHLYKEIIGHKRFFQKKIKVDGLLLGEIEDVGSEMDKRILIAKAKFKTQRENSKNLCMECLDFLKEWNQSIHGDSNKEVEK